MAGSLKEKRRAQKRAAKEKDVERPTEEEEQEEEEEEEQEQEQEQEQEAGAPPTTMTTEEEEAEVDEDEEEHENEEEAATEGEGQKELTEERAERPEAPWHKHIRTVFVGNLPYSATEGPLCDLFFPGGEGAEDDETDVEVRRDAESGKSRGFAIVTLPDSDACDRFVDKWRDASFEGRTLLVRLERKGLKARAGKPKRRREEAPEGPPPARKQRKRRSKHMSDARRAKKEARAARRQGEAAAGAA